MVALLLALSAQTAAGAEIVGGAPGVLIGSEGDIYRWQGGLWRRVPGGVAGQLTAAQGVGAEIWAIGRRVFRHDGSAWSTVPEAGRATRVGAPGSTVPGLAQGSTIRLRASGRWQTLPATPAPVLAFFAGGTRDVWAITASGAVRLSGGAWRRVPGVTGATDLAGVKGGVLLFGDGVWRGGRKLAGAEMLAGTPRLAATVGDTTFVLFTGALARIDGSTLVLVAPLPPGLEDPAACFARGEDLVVATRGGQVWAWRDEWKAEPLGDASPAARPGPPPALAQ